MTTDEAVPTVQRVSRDRLDDLGRSGRRAPAMSCRLGLIAVPVSDVARAVAFDEQVGFHVDEDRALGDGVRFVSMRPAGSACVIPAPGPRPHASPNLLSRKITAVTVRTG